MIIEGCICNKGIYTKLNMKISGETIQKEWEKVAPFAWGFFSWCPAVKLYGVVLKNPV